MESSLLLTHYDPSDHGLICLVKNRKICFSDSFRFKNQCQIVLKKRTLNLSTSNAPVTDLRERIDFDVIAMYLKLLIIFLCKRIKLYGNNTMENWIYFYSTCIHDGFISRRWSMVQALLTLLIMSWYAGRDISIQATISFLSLVLFSTLISFFWALSLPSCYMPRDLLAIFYYRCKIIKVILILWTWSYKYTNQDRCVW